MIRKAFKALLGLWVSKPWDYMGEGAPDEWEFRVSPEEDAVLLWSPVTRTWAIFSQVVVLDSGHSLETMERRTADWTRYVEELDPDDLAEIEERTRHLTGK